MTSRIELNQLYRINNGDWTPCEKLPSAASKLSLFSSQPISQQSEQFKVLLAGFKPQTEVFFCSESRNKFVNWHLFGDYQTLVECHASVRDSQFDYLQWPPGVTQAPRLMLFDMDSTFIEIEVIDELARLHQVGDEVAQVTELAMQGKLDFAESLVSRVACLKGLEESAIDKVADNLPLSEGVVELVQSGLAADCQTAIVSGGFTPFVGRLQQQLPLFRVRANRLKIQAGTLTGEVEGDIVDATAKAEFLQELCDQLEISTDQAIAIGDGANDLLMMRQAGFSLAYRAKSLVQQQASGRMNSTTLDRLISVFGWS